MRLDLRDIKLDVIVSGETISMYGNYMMIRLNNNFIINLTSEQYLQLKKAISEYGVLCNFETEMKLKTQ